ncbi:DNA gyrase/topoisomerase IV, subunit A domain-containing protein [Hirsutella rhossiliensis]|uniref:DNA topoisomerase 2 n=1 Tax=Hirsutella rhossiliensis TaxID=111463 RepID=A0A9P8N016_9HYPO|nr:DNA gyrase/topoisomerase IV, subunit A domain-containing protein [Hirsutella rhossiliensis]KAH0965633.1 DNA gyrase/topoisomerase IV, subunit A domain-containing protein [Hirsutella rhossiliensis]
MDSDPMDESVFSLGEESDGFVPEKASHLRAQFTTPDPSKVKPAAAKKMVQPTLKAKPAAKKRQKPDSDDDSSVAEASGFSNTPPSSKKQKKAPPAKKATGKPLAELENDSMVMDAPSKPKTNKTATETYQKLTQLEHIIKRPDTYIGSVEKTDQQMWIFNKTTSQMEYRNITYVPGFYKIFDEILVNAADNKQRDKSMTAIKVNINRESGEISVENNGKGIPIVIHEKEKIYIPELIFGHLLAGSNFDDNEQKTVGGRNGYGAKLCNVFSTEFTLECQDSEHGKKYKQTWTQNMQKMHKAKITSGKSADFVRVTFKPDYDRFGMPEGISDDLEALLYRRVYDMAGTIRGVKVHLNGEQIKLKDFKAYCDLYAKSIASERSMEEGGAPTCTVEIDKDKTHPRWEVGFTVSDGTFQQVSFVNSIATTSGGTHVNYIADQITGSLLKALNKKQKGHSLKQTHLRNHIFIFVNCLVNNPAFTSQTKEQLTTKATQFGSRCTLGEDFLKKIARSEALENIMEFAQKKADKMMSKSDGSKRSRVSNAKLVEANLAGTRRGHECTLILTEGDSAKGLAVSGRAILDPDRIGVFPLRGKLLNVRDASIDQITKNQEIQNIKQFLGLKHKQVYTDTKSLRYGHLMVMADQDHDGSHIKGLLINFLQVQFPSLLQIPEFFREFITPIVKVWQGPNPKKPTKLKSFFTQPQYEEWKEAHKAEISRWQSKYFKGLGTSSNEDAQVYFTNLDEHLKEFQVMKPDEADLFELAFSKKKADARKEWLGNFVPGTFLDHSTKAITYSDFVNKELILFSMADNMRSIPSVVDGLKPGQRKVMYACFKRNLVKDKKVVELAGYVSEQTAYHHGEASLQQTIIGLAQNFVGSNNINCLEPSGNFGSRLAGGSDAASPRYTFTRLSPFARKIFSALDEPSLKYQYEDGERLEPDVYAPVIPMVLVNGADGIGTGWSTSIPNYHPVDIVKNLRRRMGRLDDNDSEEKPFEPMMPWFRGWKGNPEAAGPDRFKFNGLAQQNEQNPNEVLITELPIRMWTDDFKARLEKIISGVDGASWIKDYKEFNDHKTVHFEIMVDEKYMGKVLEEGLLERFKLTKQVATSNLVAFDTRGQIRKYEKVEEIMEEYYHYRFAMYTERKKHWLSVYHTDYRRLKNQARFIQEIIDGVLVVSKKRKDVLVQELRDRKYEAFPRGQVAKKKNAEDDMDGSDNEDKDDVGEGGARDYDYLLGMPIWSLTAERLEKLKAAIANKKAENDELSAKSEKDLWCADLDGFSVEWDNQLALDAEIQTSIRRMGRRVSKKIGAGRARKPKGDDDYAPEKKGKGKTKAPAKAETKSSQRFAEMFSAKPKVKKEATQEAVELSDNFSDDDFAALGRGKPTGAKKSQPRSASQSQSQPPSQSEEPEVGRTKRAAASKAKTLFEVSSDMDDDEMLGDIGAMVKGISKPTGEPDGRLSLYAMNRPESSHGNGGAAALPKLKTKASRSFDVDSPDDTNYELLAKSSPHKTATKEDVADSFLSDDDPIAPSKAPAAKPSSSRAAASKADTGLVPVKKARAGRPAGPKTKAYAVKRGVKKSVLDLEDDSDDDMADAPSPEPKPAARGRPGRAAASRRRVVIDDDSSLMLEEADDDSDDPFEVDDDDD